MSGGRDQILIKYAKICVIFLIVAVLAAWLKKKERQKDQQIQKLQQELVVMNRQKAILDLQYQLSIPSEALYFDLYKTNRELSELRIKHFAAYGVKTFLPYVNLVSTYSGTYSGENTGSFEFPVFMSEGRNHLAALSQESYWRDHIPRVCIQLAANINENRPLGVYFKEHPAEFDQYIRPRIVRLLDAFDPNISYFASLVLLAMGDRSEELMEILSILASDDTWLFWDRDRVQIAGFNLNLKPYAGKVADEYKLGKDHPHWQRVHELTAKLKAKYPVNQMHLVARQKPWHHE